MEQTNDVDRRLTELEIKADFAEDLLETLNAEVARQQLLIDTLVSEVARLREQWADAQAQVSDRAATGPRGELPPHY